MENKEFFQGADIWFVGSCGISGEFLKPEVFEISKVSWLPLGERKKISHRIGDLDPPVTIDHQNRFPLKNVICSSNLSLSNEGMAENDVENVEAYGVVHALQKNYKSFSMFLVSTNQVGAMGHEQWISHHKHAAQTIAEALT